MKNNKQSSVVWLFEELFNSFEKFNNGDISFSEYMAHNLTLREQAQAMHKEEIIQSNRDGVDMCVGNGKFITGEQYYNETFNPNEK